MKILLLESFYTSSHKQWADGLVKYSQHEIDLLTMPGRHWKWRMEQSAIYFADQIVGLESEYDLILCTDLMNVAVLRGLLSSGGAKDRWFRDVPVYLYFHENQITYPWSENDPDIIAKRDNHYGWINYLSCLAADKIFFNSSFHKQDFLNELPSFLGQFPDDLPLEKIQEIEGKSSTLYIGLDIESLSQRERKQNPVPMILWNHRWEYDKNPQSFFDVLFRLEEEGIDFNVIVAGEKYKRYPEVFDVAKKRLGDRIIHFGYARSKEAYEDLLLQSDILPVTSNQDFFGISAIEGIAAGCFPLLPDRLAFSEHIDVAKRKNYYYGTDEALYQKMKGLLIQDTAVINHLRTYVLKYDWKNVIEKYDDVFSI